MLQAIPQDNEPLLANTQMLVAALKDPTLYDHPVTAISVIETHISWIILTGAYAYKIKKPVDFGFIDFTTLEKRKFYCEEELRLNRRFSDHLYLKVIAIRGSHTHPQLRGEDKVIDYAVLMKEFSQNLLISHYADSRRLTAEHINSIASVIASFHTSAPRAASNSAYGSWDSIVKWNHENFHHLEAVIADSFLPVYYQSLKNWCSEQENRLKPIMLQRHQNGWIRECHGDLHLSNMILIDNQCMPFDCIEFNDELRWIDTMSEIAFVVMDLQARGFDEFAWRLLNRYLAITGDYSGLSMLAFYLVYRALVRAKVEALSIAKKTTEKSSNKKSFNQSIHYMEIAQSWTEPKNPVLVTMHGLSGSGKSTVAENLASRLGAIHIRSDLERKRLFELTVTADSGSSIEQGIYTEDASKQTYHRLLELAEELLLNDFNVIVDAACLKSSQRALFRQLTDRLDIPCFLVSCEATEEDLQQRITQRLKKGTDASEANLKVLENQLRTQQALTSKELEKSGTIICDQAKLSDEQFKVISTSTKH